ncbi:MAG: hypothetical protein KJ597_06980 [Nanoarchaeota archaeon]|nr:hypothetical protein [Nanoarchaeota archaeon]MBU1623291.1 hypothetical protein [Nanoarchaeota archaeon]
MKEVIKKSLLKTLHKTINILEQKDVRDGQALKDLSDEVIEDVALYKDLDIVSMTVFIYSLSKVINSVPKQSHEKILEELKSAQSGLQQNQFGRYNRSIKILFDVVRKCNAKIRIHLQDVLQAARIKKSAILLKKGLSIGQAAGLMGLSNWDLQGYAGKTTFFSEHHEKISAIKRIGTAFKLFGV